MYIILVAGFGDGAGRQRGSVRKSVAMVSMKQRSFDEAAKGTGLLYLSPL